MSRVLYLHIGNFKTGTSAIQAFCDMNSDYLQKNGLYYLRGLRPKNNTTNHGILSLELYKSFGGKVPGWYNDDSNFEIAKATLIKEVNSHGQFDSLLISSEEFYRLSGLNESEQAVELLKEIFDELNIEVKVIMYVREPLEFVKSWYNQVTKGKHALTKMFSDFFYNLDEYFINPYITYNLWSKVFSSNNIILKEYQYSGSQHLIDFFDTMGVDIEQERFTTETVNSRVKGSDLERKRLDKLVRFFINEGSYKLFKLNNNINSTVFNDSNKLRELNSKVDEIYKWNKKFYLEFFDKEIKGFDVFDVIEHTAQVNKSDIQAFWAVNPINDELEKIADSYSNTLPELALELYRIIKLSRPKAKRLDNKLKHILEGQIGN